MPVEVVEPRAVVVPDDLRVAPGARPEAVAFVAALSNSPPRDHVDTINAAEAADTRARRVSKAVELFSAGKQR